MQRAESVHRSVRGSSVCRIRKVLEPAATDTQGSQVFVVENHTGIFHCKVGRLLSPTLFKAQLYISDEYGLRFS